MLIVRAYKTSEGLVYSEKQKQITHKEFAYFYIIHSQQWFFETHTLFIHESIYYYYLYIKIQPKQNNIFRSGFTVLNEPVPVFTFLVSVCFVFIVLFFIWYRVHSHHGSHVKPQCLHPSNTQSPQTKFTSFRLTHLVYLFLTFILVLPYNLRFFSAIDSLCRVAWKRSTCIVCITKIVYCDSEKESGFRSFWMSFSHLILSERQLYFFLFFSFLLSLVQSSLRIGNHQCNIHSNKLIEIFKIIHTKRHSHLSRDTKYLPWGSNVSYSKIIQWIPFRLGESTLIDLYICLHHYACVYIASSFLFYINLWIVYVFCETVLFLVRFYNANSGGLYIRFNDTTFCCPLPLNIQWKLLTLLSSHHTSTQTKDWY